MPSTPRVWCYCYSPRTTSPAAPRIPPGSAGEQDLEGWHCRLGGDIGEARYYAYRIDGPRAAGPGLWHAYDPEKVLLDPLAREVFFPPGFDREAARRQGSNLGKAPLGVLPRPGPSPDPVPDRTPPLQPDTAIIYEMHVRGFTRNPNSGVPPERRGTFAGVIEKIPYLKELGITMVELLPVQQFDPQEGNYWGYMTLNFFAPHAGYASDAQAARDEFRAMVSALHAADIEVILDVVYNHTAEGGPDGPTYSYRGIDNVAYYVMSGDPRAMYRDYTGCGNTLACASICTWSLILDSLRYWVDGDARRRLPLRPRLGLRPRRRRLARTADDRRSSAEIGADPILRHVRLIAEPWDAGWAYQLGTRFPGPGWCQWNGRFRDDVRRFVRGDPGLVGALMHRLYGSDDLFPDDRRECLPALPERQLHHLPRRLHAVRPGVLQRETQLGQRPQQHRRHRRQPELELRLGGGRRTCPPTVMALRQRQAKNFCCLLMLANGTPMFRAGDEFLQTQRGNNNPYNQDNETSWLDWSCIERHADFYRFAKRMIAFRKAHPSLGRTRFWREDVRWYGVGPDVDLSFDSHSLAYCLHGASRDDCDLYVMINAYHEPLDFEIQESPAGGWRRAIDTGLDSPFDIAEPGEEAAVASLRYRVLPRSVVVLVGGDGSA